MTTGSKLEKSVTATLFKNWQNNWFRVFVDPQSWDALHFRLSKTTSLLL